MSKARQPKLSSRQHLDLGGRLSSESVRVQALLQDFLGQTRFNLRVVYRVCPLDRTRRTIWR